MYMFAFPHRESHYCTRTIWAGTIPLAGYKLIRLPAKLLFKECRLLRTMWLSVFRCPAFLLLILEPMMTPLPTPISILAESAPTARPGAEACISAIPKYLLIMLQLLMERLR